MEHVEPVHVWRGVACGGDLVLFAALWSRRGAGDGTALAPASPAPLGRRSHALLPPLPLLRWLFLPWLRRRKLVVSWWLPRWIVTSWFVPWNRVIRVSEKNRRFINRVVMLLLLEILDRRRFMGLRVGMMLHHVVLRQVVLHLPDEDWLLHLVVLHLAVMHLVTMVHLMKMRREIRLLLHR